MPNQASTIYTKSDTAMDGSTALVINEIKSPKATRAMQMVAANITSVIFFLLKKSFQAGRARRNGQQSARKRQRSARYFFIKTMGSSFGSRVMLRRSKSPVYGLM